MSVLNFQHRKERLFNLLEKGEPNQKRRARMVFLTRTFHDMHNFLNGGTVDELYLNDRDHIRLQTILQKEK